MSMPPISMPSSKLDGGQSTPRAASVSPSSRATAQQTSPTNTTAPVTPPAANPLQSTPLSQQLTVDDVHQTHPQAGQQGSHPPPAPTTPFAACALTGILRPAQDSPPPS